jgi:hypothetical protein
VVLRGMGREIDVCCSEWCISEQLADDSVDQAEVEAGLKEESLRSLVEDWGLFDLLSSYWSTSGVDLELTDSFSCQEILRV